MKFLVTWQVHEGKLHDTLVMFSEMPAKKEAGLMGDGVQLLDRWHDLLRGAGVAIFEADSVEDLSRYALNWNRHMDLDISAVVDDDTARKIGRTLDGRR
jgi:hypothetical protein